MRQIILALLLCGALLSAEKRLPEGQAENESVAITAKVLDANHVKEAVGSDFGGSYAVLEVQITPRGATPFAVHLDDFILRSEANGEHSGPLVPSQIAGSGELVLHRTYGAKPNPESPPMLEGTKVEMKETAAGPQLEALKKKMLAEKTISEPEMGLLFFPLEKQKAKNLVLSYTSPKGKLRLQFK